MKRKYWTEEDDQYMRDHYPDELSEEIAKHLGRTIPAIYGRVKFLGIKKSDAFYLNDFSGRLNGKQGGASRFKKGHPSANKGKKISPEQYEKSKHTFFSKGHIPKNHKPVGTITERSNTKRGSIYLYIKTEEPGTWVELHRYNWQLVNGAIPKGMNLVFKDGQHKNCSIDNLELITNEEMMQRNTIHNQYPEEIVKTIHTLGQLKRTINNHGKKQN